MNFHQKLDCTDSKSCCNVSVLETYVKEILMTATKWVAASEEKLAYICKETLHRATHHNQYITNSLHDVAFFA